MPPSPQTPPELVPAAPAQPAPETPAARDDDDEEPRRSRRRLTGGPAPPPRPEIFGQPPVTKATRSKHKSVAPPRALLVPKAKATPPPPAAAPAAAADDVPEAPLVCTFLQPMELMPGLEFCRQVVLSDATFAARPWLGKGLILVSIGHQWGHGLDGTNYALKHQRPWLGKGAALATHDASGEHLHVLVNCLRFFDPAARHFHQAAK